MSQRLVILDFFRFIAASGVVFYHVGLADQGDALFAIVGHFNLFVDFFFILSGFVIGRAYSGSVGSRAGIRVFLRNRFARIYPLHLLMLSAFVAIVLVELALHHPMNAEKYSLSLLPRQLLLMQSWSSAPVLQYNFPAWSISVELAMYLLFPLLMLGYRRAGFASLVAVSIAGFVGMDLLSHRGVIPAWDDSYSPLRGLPTFVLGMLIALYLPAPRPTHLSWAIGAGALTLIAAVGMMMADANNYVTVALFAFTILLTAWGEASSSSRIFDQPWVRMLGDASYGIYMIHGFVVIVLVLYVWPRLFTSPPSFGTALLVWLGVTALAIPTFRWFEKPMRDWISGRRIKGASVARAAT